MIDSLVLYKVCVYTDEIKWPKKCPCCSGKPDTEIELPLHYATSRYMEKDRSLTFTIPYCSMCLNHIKEQKPSNHLITIGFILTILLLFMKLWVVAIICFILSIIISFFISTRKGKSLKNYGDNCTSLNEAVLYYGFVSGRHIFNFESDKYSSEFVKLNSHDKEITIEESSINSTYNNV
jgi:hypothetical protein